MSSGRTILLETDRVFGSNTEIVHFSFRIVQNVKKKKKPNESYRVLTLFEIYSVTSTAP